jgi:hypothetical protein
VSESSLLVRWGSIVLSCCSMHTVHDPAKDKPFVLEMGWCCEETGFRYMQVPDDLRKAANEEGKAAAEEFAKGTPSSSSSGAASA